MAAATHHSDCFYGVSDLHALTLPRDPAELRRRTRELATLLLACGLDEATLFVQSHVPAHSRLGYLLECVATTGELNRMVQFKEKSATGRASIRASLFTYPVLMAADILLYRPSRVPVGSDQRQHVELARDLAQRFNRDYGPVFVVPELALPATAARVMDLADPTAKMSKSAGAAEAGVIRLLDPPEVIRRKVARAVTDADTGPDAVRSAPEKPGVSNLIEILRSCGGEVEPISTYGALKRAVTDAVVATLEPVQRRYADLSQDPGHVEAVFTAGAARCREVTAPVLAAAEAAVGLVPAL